MNNYEVRKKKYQDYYDITGIAMEVYNEYHYGLLESAYEAAMEFLLLMNNFKVERQKQLPIYWKDVVLDSSYRMDLVVNENIIIELKTVKCITDEHRRQLFNYLNLTHSEYGMLINFSPDGIYSEWYHRLPNSKIVRIHFKG